ncbi:MAG: hypothetical protein SGPRY_001702, partial [Prymnesium sp.]
HPRMIEAFGKYWKSDVPNSAVSFDLLLAVRTLTTLPMAQQLAKAVDIAANLLGESVTSMSERSGLPQRLQEMASSSITEMAEMHLPKFLMSSQCHEAFCEEEMRLASDIKCADAARRLWEHYNVPEDAAHWLYALTNLAERAPVSVTLCDTRLPGLPMIYVNEERGVVGFRLGFGLVLSLPIDFANQEFTRLTGYTKAEAQGRNCRFLQGPNTQLAAVRMLVDGTRRGVDTAVFITNYTRTGEPFDNLLAVRAVRDDDDNCRYMVGVQSYADIPEYQRDMIRAFLYLLPTSLDQGELLPFPHLSGASDIRSKERFIHNHSRMIESIKSPTDHVTLTALLWSGPTQMRELARVVCTDEIESLFSSLLTPTELEQWNHTMTETASPDDRARAFQKWNPIWYEEIPSGLGEEWRSTYLSDTCDTCHAMWDTTHRVTHAAHHVIRHAWHAVRVTPPPEFLSLRSELLDVIANHLPDLVGSRPGEKLMHEACHYGLPMLSWSSHGRKCSWIETLAQATCHLPFAIAVADMQQPGASLVSVNKAFEELTGFPAQEAIGQSCRFLQGEETEQDALLQMVDAIRAAEPIQVELTNYRRDGTKFKNSIFVQPVHDSLGEYSYSIATLVDAVTLSAAQQERLMSIRRLLPRRFDGDFTASASSSRRESLTSMLPQITMPVLAKRRQSRMVSGNLSASLEEDKNLSSFTELDTSISKLLWLEDPVQSVKVLLGSPSASYIFQEHLSDTPGLGMLNILIAMHELESLPPQSASEAKVELAAKEFGENLALLSSIERRMLPKKLDDHAKGCLLSLADNYLASFIQSPQSNTSVRSLHLGLERPFGSSSHLLWDGYDVPQDTAGWIYALVRVVEHVPVSITVCDMSISGLPMIYEFCRLTAYSKAEAQGRNCRFLQGSETQLASMRRIIESIRNNTDSVTRVNNYRRNGEKIGVMLVSACAQPPAATTMDKRKVRYCVGVQLEEAADKRRFRSTRAFLNILPDNCMMSHDSRQHKHMAFDALLDDYDRTDRHHDESYTGAPDVRSPVRFWNGHLNMLKEIDAYDATSVCTAPSRHVSSGVVINVKWRVEQWFAKQPLPHGLCGVASAPWLLHRDNHASCMLQLIALLACRPVHTRIRWFGASDGVFDALMKSEHFRDDFDQYVHQHHQAIAPKWSCLYALAQASTSLQAENMSMSDRNDRVRQIFQELTSQSGKGRTMDLLNDAMEKIVQPINENMAANVFPKFLEMPEFLRVLEHVRPEVIAGTIELPNAVKLATFEEMLSNAVHDLPYAVCFADMHQPAARLVGVNPAFERLTGYKAAEVLGRNCRFLQVDRARRLVSHAHDLSHLQGEDTEQDAVLQLVVALRTAKKVQLHITNYRKDGSPFTNFLSLHPVHDWRGAYRYAIAILVDASLATQEDRNMIERLRRLFPGRLDVELQPIKYAEALGATMPAEWLERQRHAMQRNFALLLWLEDPCFALTVLARDEELLSIFNMELRSAGRQQLEDGGTAERQVEERGWEEGQGGVEWEGCCGHVRITLELRSSEQQELLQFWIKSAELDVLFFPEARRAKVDEIVYRWAPAKSRI